MDNAYGKTLVVQYVDQIAATEPSRLMFLVPKGNDPRDGFYEITYKHFARAVDYLAKHLETKLGNKDKFDTLGFVGHPGDFRYAVITFAVMKIGWVAFYTSPRNSVEAQLSLLEQSKCNVWLVDHVPSPIVLKMANQHPLRSTTIPSEKFFLLGDFGHDESPYPYTKTFEDGRDDIFAIMHTSGSTGIPKAIFLRQSWLTAADALKNFPHSDVQFYRFKGLRVFVTFPWFHTAAYTLSIACNMFYGATTVIAPSTPLTAEKIDLYHQFAGIDVTIAAPAVLKELAYNTNFLKNCARLKFIANGGGSSTKEVGEILSEYTHPINVAGTTEGSLWPTLMLEPEDFMYWSFDPSWGAAFRAVENEEFELWHVRDDNLRDYQAIFGTFPDLQEWNSNDLFTKHPTKSGLWKLVGRSDDVITLGAGLKVNTEMIENEFSNHPHFNAVVAFGEGQSELGLLVDVSMEHKDGVKSELSKILTQYNVKFVAHGRIAEDMVVMATANKPFPRTGKGTIQKALCRELYKEEIQGAYRRHSQPDEATQDLGLKDNPEKIIAYISEWITTKTGHTAPTRDQDFFESASGIDSMLIARLARTLTSVLPGVTITAQTVYANPTLSELAGFITGHHSNKSFHDANRRQQMDTLLEENTKGLSINARPAISSSGEPLTVAMTGTTGSLGSYLLDSLLTQVNNINKIYCLNRSADSENIQQRVNSSRGLSTDFRQKVNFLQVDLDEPRLGLELSAHKDLLENVDVLLHNAWTVDFNEALESFKSQIAGVRQLANLCSMSRKGARLQFISTIGTVENWRRSEVDSRADVAEGPSDHAVANVVVPEQSHPDWSSSAQMGYAESKQISEVLLATACSTFDIPVTIHRVGQIAGPIKRGQQGMWLKHQWVPALIQTSIALNTFPADLGTMSEIDWIPVDIISEIIVELAMPKTDDSDATQAAQFYHLVNPRGTTWPALLPSILEKLPSSNAAPETVPLHEWVEKVKAMSDKGDVETFPALKLIPFYESISQPHKDGSGDGAILKLDTTKTRVKSEKLAAMEIVKPEWMGLWMEQWAFAD